MRKIIPDDKVFMVWVDPKTGEETSVPPSYYQENGTPVTKNGDDFEYIRTEIEQ